ncbi:MAG: thioesterase II family protein [Anaerolineales bacterium]
MEQELFVNLPNWSLETERWVSCPRPNPTARLRLFFFPYAGAGSTSYNAWTRLFSPEIEIYLVHLPGRDKRIREAPFIKFPPLAEALSQALVRYLDRPFSFFGHSMGGLVSFEVARQLRRHYALTPVHLFISGRWAPHIRDARPKLQQLPEKEFLAAVESRYGELPRVVLEDQELLKLFLSILRADLTLLENYQYTTEAPLECPISVFGGLQDSNVRREELLAWRDQTTSHFDLKMFPGAHFFIQDAKPGIAQAINADLGRFINTSV